MKLRYILLLLLCSFLLFYINYSYAMTSDEFLNYKSDINGKITTLYNKGVITEACKTNMIDYINNQLTSSTNLSGLYTIVIGKGNKTSTGSFSTELPTSDALYVLFHASNGSNPVTNASNLIFSDTYYDWSGYREIYGFYNNQIGSSAGGPRAFNQLVEPFYCYTSVDISTRSLTLEAGQEYGGQYLTTSLKFITDNSRIQVFYNGQSRLFIPLDFTYSVNSVKLGYLQGFEDIYEIEGFYGPYVSGDITDSSLIFHYDDFNGALNSRLFFVKADGSVQIKTSFLIPKQGYRLTIMFKESRGSSWQDLTAVDYYTRFYGSGVSSGELISPDLNSSVDIGFVNALDDYFNYNSGDVGNINYILNNQIFNFNISGDIYSGDLAKDLGYVDYYDNDYSDFIFTIYKNVIELIESPTINSYISFEIKGNNFTIYATDFAVPDGPLKTFVRTFLIAGFVYLVYLQIHFIFLTISVLDITGLLNSFDRQHTFFM